MNIVVTGSIAFDYLMSFPGKFTEHFLPEHMSRVSLSFLVDTMDKRRGGCAPNIAYTLALLGERPRLMATAGQDFGDYRRWLEAAQRRHVARQGGRRQVHRVVLLQHRRRQQPDRVVLHRRDGQRRRAVVPRRARLRPGDHFAERSGRDAAVRGGMPRRSAFRSSGIRASSARGCPATSCKDGHGRRDDRHLQRLRVRADPPEDGAGRGRDPRSERRAGRHPRRARLLDHRAAAARPTCRPSRRTESSIRPASATRFAAGF